MLERSRARSFLAALAERDVRFTADIQPPACCASARRRKRATTSCRRPLARLGSTDDQAKVSRLVSELHMQRTILDRISARIRATSPRAATARYPKALSTKQIPIVSGPWDCFYFLRRQRQRMSTLLFLVYHRKQRHLRPASHGPSGLLTG